MMVEFMMIGNFFLASMRWPNGRVGYERSGAMLKAQGIIDAAIIILMHS
jgi:hypothetical protein